MNKEIIILALALGCGFRSGIPSQEDSTVLKPGKENCD
jgi:hypothetical protein